MPFNCFKRKKKNTITVYHDTTHPINSEMSSIASTTIAHDLYDVNFEDLSPQSAEENPREIIEETGTTNLSSESDANIQAICSSEFDGASLEARQNQHSLTNMKTLLSYSVLSSPSDQSSELNNAGSFKESVGKTGSENDLNENSHCHEGVVQNFETSHSPTRTMCESNSSQNTIKTENESNATSSQLIKDLKPTTERNIGDHCDFSEPSTIVPEKENETFDADQLGEAIKKALIETFVGDGVPEINIKIDFVPEISSTVSGNEEKELFNNGMDAENSKGASNETTSKEEIKPNKYPSIIISKDKRDLSSPKAKSTFVNTEVYPEEEVNEQPSNEVESTKETENASTENNSIEIHCEELLDGNQSAFNNEIDHLILTEEVNEGTLTPGILYQNEIEKDIERSTNCNEITSSFQFISVRNNSIAHEGVIENATYANENASDSRLVNHYDCNDISDNEINYLLNFEKENMKVAKEAEQKPINNLPQSNKLPEKSDNLKIVIDLINQTVGDLLQKDPKEDNDAPEYQNTETTNDIVCRGDCGSNVFEPPEAKDMTCRLSATLRSSQMQFSSILGLENTISGHAISPKEKETNLNDKLPNNVPSNSFTQENISGDVFQTEVVESHVATVEESENMSTDDKLANCESLAVADSSTKCENSEERPLIETTILIENEEFPSVIKETEISLSPISAIDGSESQDNYHQARNLANSDNADSINECKNIENDKFLRMSRVSKESKEEIQRGSNVVRDIKNEHDGVKLNKSCSDAECEKLIDFGGDSVEKISVDNFSTADKKQICLNNLSSSECVEIEQYNNNENCKIQNYKFCDQQNNQSIRESNHIQFNDAPLQSIPNIFEPYQAEALSSNNSFNICSENEVSDPKEGLSIHNLKNKCNINIFSNVIELGEGMALQKNNIYAVDRDKIRTEIQLIISRALNIVQLFKDLSFQKFTKNASMSKKNENKSNKNRMTTNIRNISHEINNLPPLSFASGMDDLVFCRESEYFSLDSSPVESPSMKNLTAEQDSKIGAQEFPWSLPLSRKCSEISTSNFIFEQQSTIYAKEEYKIFCGILNKTQELENRSEDQTADLNNSITCFQSGYPNPRSISISQSEPRTSYFICPATEPSDQGDTGYFENDIGTNTEREINIPMGDSGIDNCHSQDQDPILEFGTAKKNPRSKVTIELSSRRPTLIVKCSGNVEVRPKKTVLPKKVTSQESITEVCPSLKYKSNDFARQFRNVKESEQDSHVQLFDKKKIENMIKKNLETFKANKSDTLKSIPKATNTSNFLTTKTIPLNMKRTESQRSNSEKLSISIPKEPSMKRGIRQEKDSTVNKFNARHQVRSQSKPT